MAPPITCECGVCGVSMVETTRLVRNKNGGVHYRGCPYSGKTAVPWIWAEGRDDYEWRSITWLHACSYCFGPFGGHYSRAANSQKELT